MLGVAELGIDIPSILMKTKAILLHQMKANTLDELDFGGALVFLLALGCLHLMVSSGGTPQGSVQRYCGGFLVPQCCFNQSKQAEQASR